MRKRLRKIGGQVAGWASTVFLSRRSRKVLGELLEVAGLGVAVAAAWTLALWAGLLALGVALFAYGVSMDPDRKGDS